MTISKDAWITTICELLWCLNPEHLAVRQAIKLRYPEGFCVYCGMPCRGENRVVDGELTYSVPACSDCDEHGWTLRAYLETKREEKLAVLTQLAWPEDPDYDRRAFERSGVVLKDPL